MSDIDDLTEYVELFRGTRQRNSLTPKLVRSEVAYCERSRAYQVAKNSTLRHRQTMSAQKRKVKITLASKA